jgi:hypothetical protein
MKLQVYFVEYRSPKLFFGSNKHQFKKRNFCMLIYHHQSSSRPEAHKAETNLRHSIRSYAILSISRPVLCASFRSISRLFSVHLCVCLYFPVPVASISTFVLVVFPFSSCVHVRSTTNVFFKLLYLCLPDLSVPLT